VKFNSDYLSNKELKAMSGEVKAYRLNDPMRWKEFKKMPDDIKAAYIKNIQERYHAPAYKIAEMFGVSAWTISDLGKRLGICFDRVKKSEFDADGWQAWLDPITDTDFTVPEEIVRQDFQTMANAWSPPHTVNLPYIPHKEEKEEAVCIEKTASVTPCSGCLTFTGAADDALKTVARILGNAEFKIEVTWSEV
jgi:hypothetical protein